MNASAHGLIVDIDVEKFSEIVGALYDAAIEPPLFSTVMEQIKTFLDAAVVVLFAEDAVTNAGALVAHSAMNPHWSQKYFDTYMAINPVRAPSLPSVRTGDTFNTLTYLTDEEFRNSRYYREWFAPVGYLDTVSTVLERSSFSFGLFSAVRHADRGYATQMDIDRVNLLAPHLRRAVGIAQLIDLKSLELQQLEAFIDQLATPVIFSDHKGKIVHANGAAVALLDKGDVIAQRRHHLVVKAPDAAVLMSTALAATDGAGLDRHSDGAAIIMAEKSCRYIAHVLPLRSGRRTMAGRQIGASAAIFIRDLGIDVPSAAASLQQLFNLTPRELTVLLSVAAGNSASATSAILGLSEDTIKTHLKSGFRKVGVHKQSELAALVANVTNPFLPP